MYTRHIIKSRTSSLLLSTQSSVAASSVLVSSTSASRATYHLHLHFHQYHHHHHHYHSKAPTAVSHHRPLINRPAPDQLPAQRLYSSITTMAPCSSQQPSLTDTVLKAVKSLYPEELADKAWDNTGLLVGEAPSFTLDAAATTSASKGKVLLTNDMTAAVVDEALSEGAKVIICYHPVIFRPLKSITANDPMQAQLLRLIAAGVSVYCPHTAVDAASGGLNDWLCDLLLDGDVAASKTVVEPITRALPEGHEGCGYGRTVEFSDPISFSTLLKRFSKGIGGHRYMMVALPSALKKNLSAIPPVSKAAVCAGSGSSVLCSTDAQVLVTGEMSHHDALRHSSLGQIVVTVFHSNSERQYLVQRMKPMLEEALKDSPHADTRVLVSKADSDPFDVIDVESL